MTTTPIADAMDTGTNQEDLPRRLQLRDTDPAHPYSNASLFPNIDASHPLRPGGDYTNEPQTDFMSDLVDAQQILINAQHTYLHDSNIGRLAAAQHGFIIAQGRVLERLQVFG